MFYSQLVLAKKGPLGKIWLAAHLEKKVPKLQIMSTNIPESVDNIENPDCPMALRVSGHLLLGVVRIFSRKVSYLMSDCSEAIVKIKDAFSGPGVVHLAPGASTRRYDEITNPEGFDEMDLDTALPSQAFARNDDDDLLAGMSLPEGAYGDVTLPEPQFAMEGDMALDGFGDRPAFGDDGYAAEDTEAAPGFGVNDNIEVFEAPLDLPSSKRARRSPAAESPAAGEEMEMEVERMRSAVDGASPVGVSVANAEASDVQELPLGPEPEMDLELPRFDEGDAQLNAGLDAAVVDDFDVVRRASMDDIPESLPVQLSAAEELDRRASQRPKRKMLVDDEIQIPTAQMKAQLNDTSNITVDLDNFAGASQAAVAHSSRSIIDPYLAPPSLEFVPAELLARPCFKSAGGAASPKRRRSSISTRASLGERPPTTSGIAAGEEGQVVEERSPQADIFAPEELPQYFGVEQDPYLPFDDQPPFETSGMQEGSVEFEPPADEPSSARRRSRHAAEAFPLPPSFAAATALPEVDASASAHPIDSGGSSQGARPFEDNWSLRTQKMYNVLADAFIESEGMALSYDAMVARTAAKHKRRVVAGCFQELLFLTTHGVTQLVQGEAYSDIIISKAEGFDSISISAT
mmetsp:Transcript_4879/g.14775  ORF Transcript_4879/g.14775 Transcript_4879/m.14775 type:complete len:632 (-) Transcript_4879:123-2018(-)